MGKIYLDGWTQRIKKITPNTTKYYFALEEAKSSDKRIVMFVHGDWEVVEIVLLKKISNKEFVKIESRVFTEPKVFTTSYMTEVVNYLHGLMRRVQSEDSELRRYNQWREGKE